MTNTNITSHGQSGGITAHTVNNLRPPAHPPSRSKWWKRWWVYVGGAVGLFASIATVLDYFGIFVLEKKVDEKTTINITSTNQSGGITAHTVKQTVNMGPQQRHFTQRDVGQIKDHLPAGADVAVTAMMSDVESQVFAQEILNWLKANGYPNAGGVNLVMLLDPYFGQGLRKKDGKYEILVGTHPR